ncbi:MAG TPA: glycosyltransferase family 1 protein [Burkholderiales bacterium]|nr:glycosyltransferase family 1 protein [Burkholderiales bacterium]
MIRVGFFFNATGQVWLGGSSYFRNLLTALADLPEQKVRPVILTGSQSRPALLAELPSADWRSPASLQRYNPRWIARKILAVVTDSDRLLERELIAMDIHALSHSGHLGPGARVPVLAWIPDFQHLRLPQNFSGRERWQRDHYYARLCRFASRVIVSSDSVRKDLAEFCPEAIPRCRVLPFVANVPDPETLPSREMLERKYSFSGRYFFLPNQFWVHKNHRVIVDALSVLQRQGMAVVVLASGSPVDDRHPEHFGNLTSHAGKIGVAERFKVLGLVPYADLMALMWHSVAVINPSRFEGWSTTVEEAKSLGIPVIVSDIAVHREQQPPGGAYFPPNDAEAAAEVMRREWESGRSEARQQLGEDARRQLAPRRNEFARRFESYVMECLEEGRPAGR